MQDVEGEPTTLVRSCFFYHWTLHTPGPALGSQTLSSFLDLRGFFLGPPGTTQLRPRMTSSGPGN